LREVLKDVQSRSEGGDCEGSRDRSEHGLYIQAEREEKTLSYLLLSLPLWLESTSRALFHLGLHSERESHSTSTASLKIFSLLLWTMPAWIRTRRWKAMSGEEMTCQGESRTIAGESRSDSQGSKEWESEKQGEEGQERVLRGESSMLVLR